MAKVYLGLGTNLGEKEKNLRDAVEKINERVGEVISLSAFYETDPWGFQSDNTFLNAALCAETRLSPRQLLCVTQQIEREIGRTAKSVNHTYKDRLIDIDLLLYDELILREEDLILPHPLMHQRGFVMQPLAEIAPDVVHPVLGKMLLEISQNLSNTPEKE